MSSLYELMEGKDTKKDFLDSLQPKIRLIALEPMTEEMTLGESIRHILSLTRQAVEHQGHFVRFQILNKKNKPNDIHRFRFMKFPQYGAVSQIDKFHVRNTAVLITLLRTIEQRFELNQNSTVRDVFYSNVELYRSQTTVSYWLAAIANTFQLKETNVLNIVPAQKGLVFATVPLIFENSNVFREGMTHLIPYINTESMVKVDSECSKIDIKIFEKDAVFNKVVQTVRKETKQESTQPQIIITGKGYPDNLTKVLVQKLSCLHNCYLYVDADPYGINIALMYISGCKDGNFIQYKGATILELVQRNAQLLTPSQNDIKTAQFTLERVCKAIKVSSDMVRVESLQKMKVELQRQMFLGKKGEMNAMYL